MTMHTKTRLLAGASALLLIATAAFATAPFIAPASSATVGVPYNSNCQFDAGGAFISGYAIASGALPGGLTLNPSNCAITGTPNAAGTFNFTVQVTYFFESSNVTASQAARGVKQAGSPGATTTSPTFTITVAPGATTTPVGTPTLGEWAMFGLAGGIALLGGLMLRKRAVNS
jgi:hypothetical protein